MPTVAGHHAVGGLSSVEAETDDLVAVAGKESGNGDVGSLLHEYGVLVVHHELLVQRVAREKAGAPDTRRLVDAEQFSITRRHL